MEHRFTIQPRYTFMESMKSLFNTAKETIKATMHGEQAFASSELYEQRLAICEKCQFRVAHGPIWKCGVCNCLLHIKAGTLHAVCPEYFWPGDERWKPKDFVHRTKL